MSWIERAFDPQVCLRAVIIIKPFLQSYLRVEVIPFPSHWRGGSVDFKEPISIQHLLSTEQSKERKICV